MDETEYDVRDNHVSMETVYLIFICIMAIDIFCNMVNEVTDEVTVRCPQSSVVTDDLMLLKQIEWAITLHQLTMDGHFIGQ